MVEPNSARLDYETERCFPVDCDHSQIAKLKKGEGGIYPTVKSTIKHGLISTARIVAGKEVSQEYPRGGKVSHLLSYCLFYEAKRTDPKPGLDT